MPKEIMATNKSTPRHANPQEDDVFNKDQFTTFLRDSDPQNPFGINYVMRTREEKIYSKFREIRKYANLSMEDSEKVVKGNFKFFSKLAFIGMVSTIPVFLTQFALRKHNNRLSPIFWTAVRTFSAVLGTISIYTPTYNELINETYMPLLEQYLPLAMRNGFTDYEISSDTPTLE